VKILIITANVGRTAPGIVFERLINGLSVRHEVDLISADYDPSIDLSLIKRRVEIKKRELHPRLFKLIISILGIDPLDMIWKRKVLNTLKKKESDTYDVVFSLISFHHYSALIAGEAIARKNQKSKFVVYSVDAIPAPIGWSNNDVYFRKVRSLMSKYIPKTDVFFSANKQMLEYQLSFIKTLPTFSSDVLYNPSSGVFKQYETTPTNPVFLYTGGIYQVRKVDYILKAFERFVEQYPNSKFIFVGSQIREDVLKSISTKARSAIEIHPFTRDLDPFYKNATALIDIDADLENDVFLSSKIVNYLNINRIIISETGLNSPSRHLFKEIPSIIQCDHNSDELYEAMIKSNLIRSNISYEDRLATIEIFSVEKNIEKFEKIVNSKLKFN
jgi:hypothetical protein